MSYKYIAVLRLLPIITRYYKKSHKNHTFFLSRHKKVVSLHQTNKLI